MISRDQIQKILEAGAQAPSGSNSQPWRFEVLGNTISIYMLPEKDHPVLNFRNRGTLLANGALIENIVIAADHYGIGTKIDIFPKKDDQNLVANILLEENGGKRGKEDPELFNAIWKRATNRRPYGPRKISEEIETQFTSIPAEIGEYDIVLKLTNDSRQIRELAVASSVNEVVMLENEQLHRLFVDEIVWSEAEEKKRKSGLYLKTMELKPPQAFALKMFRNWGTMRFFNKFGAARGIAKSNAKGYAATPSYGAVMCDNDDREFVGLGRVIERTWLKATGLGLSLHLQTGTNFLWQGLVFGKADIFSPDHETMIKHEHQKIVDVFGGGGKLIPAIFRIGYDGEPSARSSKKSPEVIFK